MERVTKNTFAETRIRGCNPGYVVTRDGVVVIDTPQLPTHAIRMRQESEKHGPIRYIINTEHHVDHIFGNFYFRSTGVVVSHEEVFRQFMVVTPVLNPYAYAKEAIPTDDPEGSPLFPDEETYFRNPNKPTLTFTGDLTLRVGDHTFHLLSTPGHTRGQIAVYIPEERVVFVGDTIFNNCQTWIYEADPDAWLIALKRIESLDVDCIVPGHGPVCAKGYLSVQSAFLREWMAAVAVGISKGWTKEECIKNISFLDRFPVDIGQEYMGQRVQEMNVSSLYDYLTKK
ncbi:MAG: MBL fold metallo-hydrolase [Deltaproteobacteria bacterium RBG_16_47_11]|nr:MAG: MBL fold metallo-hydrolase [Deltaproteobacteria bacterium RBG_16_47_11]